MLTPLEILQKARDLIADEDHWTRGAYARNEEGKDVEPWRSDAVRWCAVGALARVVHFRPGEIEGHSARMEMPVDLRAAHDAFDLLGGGDKVQETNDGHDIGITRKPRPAPKRHEKVLAMYDAAIEKAKQNAGA